MLRAVWEFSSSCSLEHEHWIYCLVFCQIRSFLAKPVDWIVLVLSMTVVLRSREASVLN